MNKSKLTEESKTFYLDYIERFVRDPDKKQRALVLVESYHNSYPKQKLIPIGGMLGEPYHCSGLITLPSAYDQILIVIGHLPLEDGGFHIMYKALAVQCSCHNLHFLSKIDKAKRPSESDPPPKERKLKF